ncbi:MAG: hypothetical protein ACKVKR_13310, partial [Pseudomonadales bacterium]
FGTGTPSYQWYVNTTEDYNDATPIAAGTNANYTPDVSNSGSFYYFCTIAFDIGGCDLITSGIAGIHVNNIVIGQIGVNQEICFGEQPDGIGENTATTGIGNLVYQWLYSVDSAEGQTSIIGAESADYQPPILYDTTYYSLQVTSVLNSVGCVDTTNAVEIVVFPLPILSLGPPDIFCLNDGLVALTEFEPNGGVWEGLGVVDPALGLFDPMTGVGDWDLIFWFEEMTTGCRDTLEHDVTVHPIPTAAFDVPTLACNNLPLDIFQNSSGSVDAQWNFGNEFLSEDWDPIYIYP